MFTWRKEIILALDKASHEYMLQTWGLRRGLSRGIKWRRRSTRATQPVKGTSITQQMIFKEIKRHHDLKIEIRKLKIKLKKIKASREEVNSYKKFQIKALLKK